MKARLLTLYELHKIDKELQELNSLKGDIPLLIAELTDKKAGFEKELDDIKNE